MDHSGAVCIPINYVSLSIDGCFLYSYFYIIVATSDFAIENIQEIVTEKLLEESTKTTPLFYVAGVVNASQYIPGHRMSYILGAGDNTTDPDGRVFSNREVKLTYWYFFRVFSADSTPEV